MAEAPVRTQVAIIGAGPAGLFLAHLLNEAGIDSVVLEQRSQAHVAGRVRAGVLEPATRDLMVRLGIGGRMVAEGLIHTGFQIAWEGARLRVDLASSAGASVTVYGQSEIMGDLGTSAAKRDLTVIYGVENVELLDCDTVTPTVVYDHEGRRQTLACDFVAGCDGFHGVSRASIPARDLKTFEKVYPIGWLGILADVPPVDPELIYARHGRGFALASMRSLTRSRYYVQCPLDDEVQAWSDDRFWDELSTRLGPDIGRQVVRGASFEKSIAPLRSFVAEPMRWGCLFLAGDAAHIVPPTGAKGLNLAVSDVIMLSQALVDHYESRSELVLDRYSSRALDRVWKAQRFSSWLTRLTHRFPADGGMEGALQSAELDYIAGSKAALASLAENYVGLPIGD
jgi:p-hydroxybenzoate 3-monooxygenase